MTPDFAKLNCVNSKSLHDVKRYTTMALEIDPTETTYDYLGPGDLANAHLWEGDHFNYSINQFGFREENEPHNIDIAAFGCSFTFGSGLPNHSVWHNILASKLNKSSYNFGAPAKGIESIVDIFLIVSKHIQMQSAVFLMPSYSRKQIAKTHPYTDDIVNYVNSDIHFNFNSLTEYKVDCELLYKALPDEELFKACRDKLYLLDHIAKQRNIKVYISSWEKETYNLMEAMDFDHIVLLPRWGSLSMELVTSDLARDKLHPGVKHHETWADLIQEYINV